MYHSNKITAYHFDNYSNELITLLFRYLTSEISYVPQFLNVEMMTIVKKHYTKIIFKSLTYFKEIKLVSF